MRILVETDYYTPTIEEFHIGFEFEEEFNNPNWNKMIKPPKDNYEWVKLKLDTSHSISRIISKIKQRKVRVKCLNYDDLKELGFSLKWEEKGTYYFTDLKDITLQYCGIGEPRVEIYDHNILDKFKSVLFRGIIKNKFELNKLLYQLKIK